MFVCLFLLKYSNFKACSAECDSGVLQKKKYDRVKTMDDDEDDDDEKDLIADEIFHGDVDGDGELEEGENIEQPLHHADEDEEGEDEESGWF